MTESGAPAERGVKLSVEQLAEAEARRRSRQRSREAQERGRIGAGVRWSRSGAREAQAEKARAAMRRRLEQQVDPDGRMTPDEVDEAITAAAKAQMARIRLARLNRVEPKPPGGRRSGPARTVLGPECFLSADGAVIEYRGVIYRRAWRDARRQPGE